MKKLFFAVVLTMGSFMFINARVQVQPQDNPQSVQDTTVVKSQGATSNTAAQQQNDSVSNKGNAVVK